MISCHRYGIAGQTDFTREGAGGSRMVSGNHDYTYASGMTGAYGGRYSLAWRIQQPDQSGENQIRLTL